MIAPSDMKTRQEQGIFPVKCVVCAYEFYARKSIFMDMGMNWGGGSCPGCKTYLRLKMFPDLGGYEMVSSLVADDTEVETDGGDV